MKIGVLKTIMVIIIYITKETKNNLIDKKLIFILHYIYF